MKKKFLILITFIVSVLSISAENTLSVSGANVAKGKRGTFGVNLNNTDNITAFQMTLSLPEGINYESCSPGARFVGSHSFSGSSSTITVFTLLSSNNDLITGNSGLLFSVEVSAASNITAEQLTATLSNIELTKLDGEGRESKIELENLQFDINITEKVILDEESTAVPVSQNDVDVTVYRTLKADVWNTLCLPFGMTKDKALEIFGNDAKFCYLESVEEDGSTIIVNFEYDNLSEYDFMDNYPYLVKTTTAITDFTVSRVEITPNESKAIISDSQRNPKVKFIGTLKAGTVPDNNLFISDNQFWYSDGTSTIKGFRGYFWLKDFQKPQSGTSRQLQLNVDGQPTAIYNISSETGAFTIEDGRIYDLKGQQIDSPTQKGIYIQNGKKIIKK